MLQKMNWMRFSLIGISIFIGLSLNSCDKGEVDYRSRADYYYTNKTNVPIRIKTFDERQNGYHLLKDYEINKNDTLLISFDIATGGLIDPDEIGSILLSDSTVVIYDQTKCESFGRSDIRGITDMSNYNVTKLDNNYYKFEYVFTNEQFQNAEDCD